jgi:hypothetical protein
MMAVVPGDYNLNGVVQVNDYTIWKSNYGNYGEVAPGDGNGDGIVSAADYTVWRNNLGATLASVPPDPPKSITVQISGATSVKISWEASAFAVDYTVQRRQPQVTEEFIDVATNVIGTNFLDNSVLGGVIYEYQVLARNDSGVGSSSGSGTASGTGGGFSAPSQRASVTAGQSALTAYRPQQFHDPENLTLAPIYTPFAKLSVAEVDEESTTLGPGIRINYDDDNQNGLADVTDVGFPLQQENDLIEVRVDRLPGQGDLALVVGFDLRLFYTYDKEVRIPLVMVTRTEPLEFVNDTVTVFVEWITEGHGTEPLQLVNATTLALLDTIRFHTFHSAVIALGGEFQTPTPELPPNNHGIFKAGIELYNQGYDVRIYDEDDVDADGSGVVFDEIRNSINNQFYTEVAMFGYSHGGGSVYDLSVKLMDESTPPFGTIIQPFTITMTSYIDAIETSVTLAENQRPELSEYHLNQFQQNTGINGGFLNGTHTTDLQELDDEVNYTGLELVHKTIDDDFGVLFLVGQRVRQKVTR